MVQLGLPIYDFLLVSNRDRLGFIFSYLLPLGQNLDPPHPPLPRGDFFLKIEWFPPWVRGKASTKNEVDRFNIF